MESKAGDHTASPTLTNHILESLFFSMSVYEPTQEALLKDLEARFGRVQPLMSYGFEAKRDKGQQVIFVARSHSGRVIVACRGTCGFKDVLQDLKYIKSRLSFAKGAAHWGFAERAESVPIDFFRKLLDAGEEIIFTGHSLGGAVASLLTLRVLESSNERSVDEQVRCITFGSPLFASSRLAEMINDKYKDIFIHIVSRRDCVPKILPFVSALQKLVYSDEDHLEGLVVLKSALALVPWLPIAPFVTALEARIPAAFKFALRCLMKLALPSGLAGSYAFAGHIVMLDTVAAVNVANSLILASAEDLNAWHSQLNFAFGSGFDVTMIEEHMLDCYHDGIVRAFSQVRVTRELAGAAAALGAPPSPAWSEPAPAPSRPSEGAKDGVIVVRMMPHDGDSGGCEVQVKSMLLPSSQVGNLAADGGAVGSEKWVVRSEEMAGKNLAAPLNRAKSLASFGRQGIGGDCKFICAHNHSRKLERSLTMMARSTSCSSSSSSLVLPVKTSTSERRQDGVISTRNDGSSKHRCRACQCLHMYMNVKGSCRQVTKNFFNFGWILGTVGRVARHLKILDNLCALTFIRFVVGNILG